VVSRVVSSWGSLLRKEHEVHELHSRYDHFPDLSTSATALPFGNGRSYGDSCLNVGGALLQTRALDRFMSFDRDTGVLACESGVLLGEIIELAVPAGWFLPVVPGTSHATVGGAIANDVHGKNHHRAGTLGCHVRQFELLRSNGERFICSPAQNTDWFGATIGGLGLTGVITWAELQLRRIPGTSLDCETIRFANVREFFELLGDTDKRFEYTVAWIDCLGRGSRLGRGLLQRANHSEARNARSGNGARKFAVPFMSPVSLVNNASLLAFNTLHYHSQFGKLARHYEDLHSFFFPLDGILHWNRLYGRRGFFQYQCVLPQADEKAATERLLEAIADSRLGSFLAVLKRFGAPRSPGWLSFPLEGTTLALDFPNTGSRLQRLFDRLDAVVAASGGRLYPAKDARMPAEMFRTGYPAWEKFAAYIDPAFSSSFWRRVTQNA
jgi:FAD/FMN-containing dehydrogenase